MTAFLELLVVFQPVTNAPPLVKHQGVLPLSQKPAAGLYCTPVESNPQALHFYDAADQRHRPLIRVSHYENNRETECRRQLWHFDSPSRHSLRSVQPVWRSQTSAAGLQLQKQNSETAKSISFETASCNWLRFIGKDTYRLPDRNSCLSRLALRSNLCSRSWQAAEG